MKRLKVLGTVGFVALVCAGSSSAFARDPGWYVGFNAGQSRDRLDNARIGGDLLGSGFATTSGRRAVGPRGNVDLMSVGLIYRFGRPAPLPRPAPASRWSPSQAIPTASEGTLTT